uniref:F-box domain-containing protein n=1 Tax=Lynx canadensis TaxID=61383 RepID=A0A667HN53_LYNCA
MAESLPQEMLTYILSFLPLSDQKEASLVSRAWYCAAQNALREVRWPPSSGPFSVVCHFSLLVALLIHHPSIHPSIYPCTLVHTYVTFIHTWLWVQCWDFTDE